LRGHNEICVLYALPVAALSVASTLFAKLPVGQVPPIILALSVYLGAGPGLLARVQMLGNCAIRLLVK